MPPGDLTEQGVLAELQKRVRLLEERVARIEGGQAPAVQPETDDEPLVSLTRIDADLTVATALTRVAMLSFVLLGALLLRTLTQQKIVAGAFGIIVGFAYAAFLIVLSFLPGRLGSLARATSLFQCCGVVLSFSIALESALHTHALARPTAMALIAGFSALAMAVASAHRKTYLAVVAIAGAIMALVSLGLESEGLNWQLSFMVILGACAAALSWQRGWAFLRPMIYPLLAALLTLAFPLARKGSIDCGPLLASVAAFWMVIALQHVLTFRQLGWAAVWLPLVSSWMALLSWFAVPDAAALAAAAVSTLAMTGLAVASSRHAATVPGMTGMAATAVIMGVFGWPILDRSGILCAIAGIVIWVVMRRSRPLWAAVSAAALLLIGTATNIILLFRPDVRPSAIVAGACLAAILLISYEHARRIWADVQSGWIRHLASPILVAGLIVFLATLRAAGGRFLLNPASFQLAQTGILAVAAVLLTFCGRMGRRRAVLYCGLACMILVLGKAAFADMVHLSGIRLLVSIILVGLSSVGVSLSLRTER